MRSASVDFPWSMWAMMQKFRISSGGVNVWSANEVTRCPWKCAVHSAAGDTIVPRPRAMPHGAAADHARRLDALAIGDDTALTLGMNPARFRVQVFVVTATSIGAVVAVSDQIGFVGLVVPHLDAESEAALETALETATRSASRGRTTRSRGRRAETIVVDVTHEQAPDGRPRMGRALPDLGADLESRTQPVTTPTTSPRESADRRVRTSSSPRKTFSLIWRSFRTSLPAPRSGWSAWSTGSSGRPSMWWST
ncbi:MAG: iron chelate uptake ABC transporter family permease subunit [Pseudonocardia sp.]